VRRNVKQELESSMKASNTTAIANLSSWHFELFSYCPYLIDNSSFSGVGTAFRMASEGSCYTDPRTNDSNSNQNLRRL
jgi:hypothetical protein